MLLDQKKMDVKHSWKLTTFTKITSCLQCSKVLLGFRNQGYSCTSCTAVVHEACSKKFQMPCKTKAQVTPGHSFVVYNFLKPTYCAVCNSMLMGLVKQGMHCIHCAAAVHESCQAGHTKPCASIVKSTTVSDVYNGRGLVFYHDSIYDQAYKDFSIALELADPTDHQRLGIYTANLGLAAFYIENIPECITCLTRAIQLGQNSDPFIYVTRAAAFQLSGNPVAADQDRGEAKKLGYDVLFGVFPFPLLEELIVVIFSFLDKQELRNCSMASRKWKHLIYSHFPDLALKKDASISLM